LSGVRRSDRAAEGGPVPGSPRTLGTLSGRAGSALVRAVLEEGNACRYRVAGRSMWPLLRDGDLVTISRFDPDERGTESPAGVPRRGRLRPGDVVAFAHPHSGRIIFHRVLQARADAVRTKGDNLFRSDGWIPRECLLGIVTERRRSGRVRALARGPRRWWAGAAEAGFAFAFGFAWPAGRAALRLPLRLLGSRGGGPKPRPPDAETE
jgi:hypothetical protein